MQWEAPQPPQQPSPPNMQINMENINPNPPIIPNQVEEEINDSIDLIGESVVELGSLNEVKVFLFKEAQEKRHILICPRDLYKCAMDICPPQVPTVGNEAMILVPSLRRSSHLSMENGHKPTPTANMASPINFII